MGGRGASFGKGGGMSKTFEDKKSGGSVSTEKSRLELAHKSKNEMAKYEKEKAMCEVLAKNGHTVVHLDDTKRSDGSYDILINGQKADLKRTQSANNIVSYARNAVRNQGADKVVFQFDKWNAKVKTAIEDLQKAGIHGYYFVTGKNNVLTF